MGSIIFNHYYHFNRNANGARETGKITRMNKRSLDSLSEHCTTIEVAQALGMAVRSVQLMVDRGELDAWKTPGGHRRIARASVLRWAESHRPGMASPPAASEPVGPAPHTSKAPGASAEAAGRVLLIEDSVHYQNLIGLLMRQRFPQVAFRVADDGIVGLALVGEWQPDVLVIDILLPGIDGATLITSLRSHPLFQRCALIVVTSLDEAQRAPYAFALQGLPVVHKPQLVLELPALIEAGLARRAVPA